MSHYPCCQTSRTGRPHPDAVGRRARARRPKTVLIGLAGGAVMLGTLVAGELAAQQPSNPQLDSACTVSALNRSAPVDDEGTWVLPNVPTTLGRVRIRATCVQPDGTVHHGQSDFVEVPPSGVIEVAGISFDAPVPSPTVLRLSATATELTVADPSVTVSAVATYPDASTVDVAADPGTSWTTSNPAILSIADGGSATAVSSGLAIISASHDGATGFLRFRVILSEDGDMDGLPDDWELANGLDPNDPLDALIDGDLDGLTSLQEFQNGTDPNRADTDGDRLNDGDELARGTDPLLRDSDGDIVPDGLEVIAGSDPLDPASVNLPPILDALRLSPSDFTLKVNEAFGEGSRQLTAEATLIDGTLLDATGPPYGTTFNSTDLAVASFGLDPGRVYGGIDGVATVSAANGAMSAEIVVTVEVFSPTALGRLALQGCANAVAVDGSWVYVASSRPALAVVDASDLSDPQLDDYLWLPGSSMDVAYADDRVFLAMHSSGVAIVDVSDPTAPQLVSQTATLGPAWGLAVRLPYLFVATELGVSVIDAGDLSAPFEAATLETPGSARDLDLEDDLLAVADGHGGLTLVDVSDALSPTQLTSVSTSAGGSSRTAAVALRAGRAWTGEGRSGLGGLRALRVEDTERPTLIGTSSDRFGLNAIALDGPIALSSDFFFVNAVPIFDISGPTPIFRTTVTFPGDPNGHDLKVADGVVYSVAGRRLNRKPNCTAGGVLQIGRYAAIVGEAPPEVRIVTPETGATIPERHPFTVTVEAEDDVLVTEVELLLNGELVGLDTASPYEFEAVAPSAGTVVELVAFARDGEAGNRSESVPVSLNVIPDDRPVARIVSPPGGGPNAQISEISDVQVVVEASDDVQLTDVELFVNGALNDSRGSSPALFSVLAPLGSTELILQARAVDNLGQTADSEPVVVNVLADPPPVVGFVEPSALYQPAAGGLIQVEVGAADNRSVDRVELKVDGVSSGEIFDPPYIWIVSVPIGPSTITLHAEAWDDFDRSSTDTLVLDILAGATTTVTGIVLDPSGLPVTGAQVRCSTATTSTAADGSFTVNDFPAAVLGVVCDAVKIGDPELVGLSQMAPPVPTGVTDVGLIVIGAPLAVSGTGGVFGQDFTPNFYAGDETLASLIRWNEFQENQPTGLAFNLSGNLWQVRTVANLGFNSEPGASGPSKGKRGGLSESFLVELDPGTAEPLSTAEPLGGRLLISTPNPRAAIIDLAVDPGTDRLYGLDHVFFDGGSRLLSIDSESGDATVIGALPAYDSAGLDFDAQRNLWVVRENGGNWQLHQVDPISGAVLITSSLSRSGTIAAVSWHAAGGTFLVASDDSIYSVTPGSSTAGLWSTPSGQSSTGQLTGLAIARSGVSATSTTFTGRVVDEFNTPLSGVEVLLPGASTTTAIDGTFSLIAVPRTAKVRVVAKNASDLAFSEAIIPTSGGSVDVGEIRLEGFGGGEG